MSVLQSLKLENPLIFKIFKLNSLIHSKKVIFCWIPIQQNITFFLWLESHIRIQGNDKADSLAKAAINMIPDKNIKTNLKSNK